MHNTLLILGASFSVFFIATGLVLSFASPRSAVLSRLGRASASGSAVSGSEAEKDGLKEDFLWVLGQLGRLGSRKNSLQQVQSNLVKAHVLMRAEEFIGLTLLSGMILYTVLFLLGNSVLLGILGGLIGLRLPAMLVKSKIKRLSAAMTDQLPEALNIISSGLRAGFSFPQAVSVVVREMEPPLAVEFSRVLRENRLGKPMDAVLNDLVGRVDNDDLELLVTALLIQRQVGGNLAEVLDSISHTIRERVRIKGEIRTLTAEGRLSAVILSLLPVAVALAISVLNPGYVVILIEEPIGIAMIIGAIILQLIGIMIIRKIVAIDV
jgi:tight adherence protein B